MLSLAIDDIGESVRGNDAKAYAALVLHGLILAGVTTVVAQLGEVYQSATLAERIVGLAFLGATFLGFLASALYLIAAVSPYRPERLERQIKEHYQRVFFPTQEIYDACCPHQEMIRRLDAMGEAEIRDELVAETLKLGDILGYESNQTARGYRLLRYEVLAAVGFLTTAAVSAL